MNIEELSQRLTDRENPIHVHLIGVAGSGMSGLASLLLGMGHKVSGSDRVTSGETHRMQGLGLVFSSPHHADEVHGADVVVYSSAIREDNVARTEARAVNIPCIRRAECLAAILHTRNGVVISGTHGKTTTSAMCAHVLRRGGIKPCHYVGAEIPVLGSNAHWEENGELMVAEGDESDGTLALYQPEHSVVLNVEEEHLDFYSGIDHIKEVFSTLLDQTRGKKIYFSGCPVATELCAERDGAVSYGWEHADFQASDIHETGGTVTFDVTKRGELLGRVELGIPGRHNVLNALAAIVVSDAAGVDFQLVARALATFAGARRRFETKYLTKKLRIIDDYGHHPTEVAATLQTARSLNPERLVVVFQPHRYSRTQKLADDFGKALQAADRVFVTDIYPASELPIEGVTAQTIVDAIKANGDTRAEVVGPVRTAHHVVGNALDDGDLLLTLGAGNVHEAGAKIARDMTVLEEMLRQVEDGQVSAKLYEPMRRHTTILCGGPAQFWLEPQSHAAFADLVSYCRERGLPQRVIGRGSNLLVRDGGIRGAVIHPTGGVFSEVTVSGNVITAGAGARFKKVASVAATHGLTGFEWMEGIPGNVGGGLRMNAGAMGTETFDQVLSVTFLDEDGEIRERPRAEITAHYRSVPELRQNYALAATFEGEQADADAIAARMEESKNKRRSSQPIAASAGCIFKNPEQVPAGMLVDELGMKEVSFGKAMVSRAHGNFIVNTGKAKSADVLGLIDDIRAKAKSQRGITMETEVQIIGEDDYTF
ncbi:UDP-N-acetylmuramate--L-alanine ligase [Verrucomicrobiaceae bacterium 5K15]|uniref:Multifunctional fusion protein n=1 Tax=Oceaniferula flava TaxID=2800421 RepID=A0AAE2SAS8_9BACT|nr:UDP-N-acetylmuramate--L-alanine ligase [Oceaniferula flavus]MBK1854002.1 UDP-N-acetylmuramate--L-alanine ligase [Oceaniferula flavus]MBM1135308.1 UDP-N-acetylmuramate--L-alanine ligase [Oceaniferula flavus]